MSPKKCIWSWNGPFSFYWATQEGLIWGFSSCTSGETIQQTALLQISTCKRKSWGLESKFGMIICMTKQYSCTAPLSKHLSMEIHNNAEMKIFKWIESRCADIWIWIFILEIFYLRVSNRCHQEYSPPHFFFFAHVVFHPRTISAPECYRPMRLLIPKLISPTFN